MTTVKTCRFDQCILDWTNQFKSRLTLGYSIMTFEFAPQKQERKGGWEPIFASNFTLNFRVLIRPYWPGQVHSIIKDIELKLCYQNQNVRGRQGLKKWQSLILFTVRNSYERRHATFIYPWVPLGVVGVLSEAWGASYVGIQCPLGFATLDKAAELALATATPLTDLRQYINSDLGFSDLKICFLCSK